MNSFNVWDGIYQSFDEVFVEASAFDSDRWLNASEEKLIQKLKAKKQSGLTDSPLPIVVSMLATSKKRITCLDFGGGVGLHYLNVKECVLCDIDLSYTIVDGKKSCEVAKKHLSIFNDVEFTDILPSNKIFDIVHVSSAMQYIDDWKALLREFANYVPEYLVFSDLVAGDNKTFISHQNYYGLKIPYRFYNLNEFIAVVEKLGYRLIYQSMFFADTLGRYTHIPMNNFPADMQVGYAKNLIFVRRIGVICA